MLPYSGDILVSQLLVEAFNKKILLFDVSNIIIKKKC